MRDLWQWYEVKMPLKHQVTQVIIPLGEVIHRDTTLGHLSDSGVMLLIKRGALVPVLDGQEKGINDDKMESRGSAD